MASVNSYSQLLKALQKVAKDVMEDDVATATKISIYNNVQNIVYDAGNPSYYERRDFTNGSLGDPNNLNHKYKNGVLEVTDDADFNHSFADEYNNGYGAVDMNESLAYNIEYGYGSKSEWWNKPRPFIEESREDMRDGEFKSAMIKGLKKRGIDSE